MTWLVVLDTGLLGYLTHPSSNATAQQCNAWLTDLLNSGAQVAIPEVCDYELRREYVRRVRRSDGSARKALDKLNALKGALEFLAINSDAMLHAAELWADARARGQPTASESELDVDVILAAQGITAPGVDHLTIATSNVGHLAQFADARAFTDIAPRPPA